MKIVFWSECVLSVLAMLLQIVIWLGGGGWSDETARYGTLCFLVSAGFLWIHHTIVARGAK